jgi:hypothetical protein
MITIQLQLLNSAPDTEVLDLASKECLARECDSSDFVNLRGSPKQISSVRWKQDSWHKFLFGRICLPSHTESFEDLWILQLRESLANRIALQENEKEEVMSDSSLTIGCEDLSKCNLDTSLLRMLKDCSQVRCQTELFALPGQLRDWKQWVTKLRQEYSVRVKLAHHINASGSSSWPTIRASEYKDTGPIGSKSHDHMLGKRYLCAVVKDVNWLTPATVQIQRADMQKRIDYRASIGRQYVPGSLEEQMQTHGKDANWPTPIQGDSHLASTPEAAQRRIAEGKVTLSRLVESGLPAPVNPSMDGSRQESWATPRTGATDSTRPNNKGGIPLGDQVQRESAWATPRTKDADGWMMNKARLEAGKPEDTLTGQAAQWATATVSTGAHRQKDGSMTPKLDRQVSGKLNPRWVETLMGLPVGWTMPSCQSPVTIAPTNCDCLETELCQPQQNEHSELF